MNGSAAPPGRGNPPLPSGLRVAGLGSRIGAWLIDSMVLGVFQVAFWLFAGAVGAVSIDPEAQRQLEASPLALPTVAPYQANLSLLALLLAAFVVLNVVYATVCWSRFRGMPGQRLLSLQVGSAATGRNLSLGSALLRAVIAVGIPIAAVAGIYYAVLRVRNVGAVVRCDESAGGRTGRGVAVGLVQHAVAGGLHGCGLAGDSSDFDGDEPYAAGSPRPIGRLAGGRESLAAGVGRVRLRPGRRPGSGPPGSARPAYGLAARVLAAARNSPARPFGRPRSRGQRPINSGRAPADGAGAGNADAALESAGVA